ICHVLNGKKPTGEEGEAGPPVPTMGRSALWGAGTVDKIVHSRAVLGEFQPHVKRGDKREPEGQPLAGYYPAVIDEATFHQAQAALAGRKNQKGPRGQHVRNLFTGLLLDASDGQTMNVVTESRNSSAPRLVSSGASRGLSGSTYRTF